MAELPGPGGVRKRITGGWRKFNGRRAAKEGDQRKEVVARQVVPVAIQRKRISDQTDAGEDCCNFAVVTGCGGRVGRMQNELVYGHTDAGVVCARHYTGTLRPESRSIVSRPDVAETDNEEGKYAVMVMPVRTTLIAGFMLAGLLISCTLCAQDNPVEVLEVATNEVIDALVRDPSIKQDPARIKKLVYEFVVPHIDFQTLSRWVLGKYWRTASEEQHAQFIREFRDLMVNTYGISLAEYSDQKLVFQPLRADPGSGSVTVHARFEQVGAPPVSLSYRMHNRKEHWLVYDVVIEGISFATTYRTTFGSEARQVGVQGLIDRLTEKNRQSQEHPPEPLFRLESSH